MLGAVSGGQADWVVDYTAIDWARVALVVIDVQNDFVDGAMPVPGTVEILPQLRHLVEAFRSAGRPIAHVIRLYSASGGDVDLVRRADIESGRRVVSPGSSGAEIPYALTGGTPVRVDAELLLTGAPQILGEREVLLYKPRWSAFHRTRLQAWLEQQNVSSVVVAGCNLPNCPRATLFDASERDLPAGLVIDAVSQTSPERLADLRRIGVHGLTVDQVVHALG
ncbi:cysteine hydrolase family protein [Enemella dayhoffiae]|uniref:cysteine hydrolase family protein n=1 Tax=Enemella dayhoffiae TaxID=2016507 RepID=UPI001E3D086E|nr:isochorismatase family cysteine hydrolase [Enemella dayhoffiae]